MMDMRQHSGGGAVPSNTLQFSPQSTLSNDNLFLLDPNFSPSPSMDMCGLNQPFSSSMGPDFPSVFMDTAFPNSLGLSSMDCVQGQGQSSNGFYAADEWSGTTNSSGPSNSHHHHHHQHPQQHQQHIGNMPSNQRLSTLTQNSVNHSVSLDVKPQPQSYDSSLSASSQVDHDVLGAQPPLSKGFNQGGDMISGQAQLQGMVKQLNSLAQSSLVGAQMGQGRNQPVMQKIESESTDFQAVFYGAHQQSQSESAMSANVPCISSHEESFQEARSMQLQALDFRNQQAGLGNSLRAGFQSMHAQQSSAQPLGYHGQEVDNSATNYQVLNSDVLFQSGHGESAAGQLGSQLGQQNDQNSQAVRSLALHLQGKLPQTALQNQLSNKYMGLPAHPANVSAQQLALHVQHGQGASEQLSSLQSHSNNHPLSMLLQSQSSAQFQSLSQAQAQVHAQVQAQAQVQAVNQQAVYQARQLQSGSQQPLLQHNSFQSIQSVANQVLPNSSHNLHLNGAQQKIAQMQPRLINAAFQGMKPGGLQVLQRSSSGASLGFASGSNEGNVRTQMRDEIAAHCIQVLMRYIQEQQKRPKDNDLQFWKNLVNEFFVPGAAKRWCLSSYNSMPMGRHAQNLFPMDYWFCNLCGVQPGRGFESSTDILPRLFKIKYASGLEDELLFLDIAEERYKLPNGRLVLEFPRAVHESIFPELRVVRYGRLRVTFSSTFKIYSWEFCTKMHEEVVPRKSLLQQAQHLAKLVADCDQEGFDKGAANLKAYCDEFTATARQLASKLEAPTVNDLGFSKRYVRCLQIAEIVNSMKDLISFEKKTRSGPISSLANFPTARKVSDELLTCSTSSQLINQLSQGNVSSSSSYSNVQLRQQAQMGNDLQSAVMQGSDVSGAHANSQTDLQSDGMKAQMPMQGIHLQAQMPAQGIHLQSQSSNPLLTQFSARSISAMQGSPYGTGQSQISSQVLNNQAVNFSQLAQQIYESAGNRQLLQQPLLNQPVTHSQSLNHTGQQSLPGTPQSEMSDMRTNT